MTTPKVNTIKRSGSRFYVEPTTGAKYPGVTSILKNLDKSFLQHWAAKLVAEEAVYNLEAVASIAARDPEAAIDMLKRTPYRNTKKAADIGTAAHDVFERMAGGEPMKYVSDDLRPFRDHFAHFLDTVQPEFLLMEETVWDDEHQYAGSFDWRAKIDGMTIWGDNKTTRSGVHAEVGLQLSAYRYAKHILRPDGTRTPNTPGDGAAVLHIRPEGWHLTPVRADEEVFKLFLALRTVFEWDVMKPTVVGVPVASGPGTGSTAPATARRRAPRAKTTGFAA
ncbi:hypothetical protein MTE01_29000 [Microbacterium testaceum]|uniref:Exonuclease n=1 Tax=Microbacterium testaceum TaxID=2033 RepID=A0A4Y3QNW2_MICTE|nr:hypothetical protein [Microbacterium testaceum]GEB46955.1 hypothetical protein MTE01_29000 [Microbacterium testaceum]